MKNPSSIPLKKKFALDLFTVKRAFDTHVHDLRYLFWECTLRCNLKCLHCGSDCRVDSGVPEMPSKDFLKVLDGIAKKMRPRDVFVCITGGEPLLRQDLAKTGEQIADKGFPWGIVTNGFQMNKGRFSELRDAGLSSVAVSLDGREADHDWFRGRKGSHKRAMETIALAASEMGKCSDFTFDVVTCVNQRNLGGLSALKERLIKLGTPRWRIATIFPKGRAANNPELKLNAAQMREVLDFIAATRREGKIPVSYGCEGFLGAYEMAVRDTPFFCRAGISIGSVLVDGSISACPSLRSDYIQGNIYSEDFPSVWENGFAVMRDRSWARTGDCKTCEWWRYCRGNGLHLRDEKSGKLLFCNYHAVTADQAKK